MYMYVYVYRDGVCFCARARGTAAPRRATTIGRSAVVRATIARGKIARARARVVAFASRVRASVFRASGVGHRCRHARCRDTAAMTSGTTARVARAGLASTMNARGVRRVRGVRVVVKASFGAAHEGVVAPGDVHGSSLASMGFAPRRTRAGADAASSSKSTVVDESVVMFRTSATCPFAHRCWLALEELDVRPREVIMENLEDKSEAFKAEYARAAVDAEGNPSVPVLTHRGATMVESALVLRYLAETFDGAGASAASASLLPKDTVKGYYGQLFADTFQTCVPLYFKMLRATNQDELDAATKEFIGGLQKANRCLELGANARAGGAYACGEQFTIWDIMPMTFVPRFEIVLAHYRGFNLRVALKENGCDALEAWIAAVGSRPSLVSTLKQIEEIRGITVQQAFIDHFAKFVSWRA